jgi:hypothetical protein
MTKAARRSGAATARRLRAVNSRNQAPVLPPELQHIADRFAPQGAMAACWPRLAPVVTEALTRSNIRGVDSFRKYLTHLGYFLAWAESEGLSVELESVVRAHTDEYARTGMAGSSEKSRSDRRARLRLIADQINPGQAPDRGVPVSRPSIKPPYTDREMNQIIRVARTQPSSSQSRKLSLCVGVGAGAGLDSPDLRHLRGRDVRDRKSAGITITTTGTRPREVTVLRSYESLVRHGLTGIGSDDLLVGKKETRRNIAARVIGEAVVMGECPRIEQSRLRSTWLASLLTEPVPLAIVLSAAGLQTARTIGDLLPYLDLPAGSQSTLRNAGWAA